MGRTVRALFSQDEHRSGEAAVARIHVAAANLPRYDKASVKAQKGMPSKHLETPHDGRGKPSENSIAIGGGLGLIGYAVHVYKMLERANIH